MWKIEILLSYGKHLEMPNFHCFYLNVFTLYLLAQTLCYIHAIFAWSWWSDLKSQILVCNGRDIFKTCICRFYFINVELLLFCHSMSDSFATPQTVACQAPLSMGFSRQEFWSGLPYPSPGDLPEPGMKPASLALQADSLLLIHQRSPIVE